MELEPTRATTMNPFNVTFAYLGYHNKQQKATHHRWPTTISKTFLGVSYDLNVIEDQFSRF
ncbi:hypothetical protein CFP56_029189 [Quercus suber]|uniref:Uncharacterized protein n=1 Tax=Quercus suber TaxID=58331 RepID=A0AAW0MBP6_QUESU